MKKLYLEKQETTKNKPKLIKVFEEKGNDKMQFICYIYCSGEIEFVLGATLYSEELEEILFISKHFNFIFNNSKS